MSFDADIDQADQGAPMKLEEIAVLEEIRGLKARYCRLLDTKDWNGWGKLFTREATLNVDTGVSTGGGDPKPMAELRGRAAIQSAISVALHDATTVHQCHMSEIALTSARTATGIWAMEDIVERPGSRLNGQGHYHENYVVEEGQWRIASLHLTRIRLRRTAEDH